MTTHLLAANVTLDRLKSQAKALLKALRSGDEAARTRVSPYFRNLAAVGLQDIHLVLAREHGFSSWTALKTYLDRRTVESSLDGLANRFLSLVSVSYFANIPADPARFNEAKAMLDAHPDIAGDSIYTAAAIGDARRVGEWLDRQPHLLERRGGPFNWPALLYAAYARLPGQSSLPAGRLLIERGADANAFFMDDGQYRFTALTGVFGEGEAGKIRQPQHPDCETFATLLLKAGANANDSQALYNRMFEPDNRCLELLLAYGLSADDRNNWLVREDGALVASTQTVFDYQLAWALQNRMPERVRLLVEHGASVTRPVRGRTPYEWALLGGNRDLARFLLSRGAEAVTLEAADQAFVDLTGDRPIADVRQTINQTTDIAAVQKKHPAMLHQAAGDNDLRLVKRMLEAGIDVNRMTSRTPLHEAALHGHMEMAKLLIASGADTRLRDPHHYAPPIGWAEFNGQTEMVQFLASQPLDIFAAAAFGATEQIQSILALEPGLLEARFKDHRPAGRAEPGRDWLTPLGFAILNGRAETVRFLLGLGANRKIGDGMGRTYRDLATGTDDDDIITQF